MPQVWHDGTSQYGARDSQEAVRDPQEDQVVREPSEGKKGCLEALILLPFMAKGDSDVDEIDRSLRAGLGRLEEYWGEEKKGCLELLLILWLPVVIMMLEVARGG